MPAGLGTRLSTVNCVDSFAASGLGVVRPFKWMELRETMTRRGISFETAKGAPWGDRGLTQASCTVRLLNYFARLQGCITSVSLYDREYNGPAGQIGVLQVKAKENPHVRSASNCWCLLSLFVVYVFVFCRFVLCKNGRYASNCRA